MATRRLMRRSRKLRLDYTRGSLRSGLIDVVGASRVLTAHKVGTCWRIGQQSRDAYDRGYLIFSYPGCFSTAQVKKRILDLYGQDALDPGYRLSGRPGGRSWMSP